MQPYELMSVLKHSKTEVSCVSAQENLFHTLISLKVTDLCQSTSTCHLYAVLNHRSEELITSSVYILRRLIEEVLYVL